MKVWDLKLPTFMTFFTSLSSSDGRTHRYQQYKSLVTASPEWNRDLRREEQSTTKWNTHREVYLYQRNTKLLCEFDVFFLTNCEIFRKELKIKVPKTANFSDVRVPIPASSKMTARQTRFVEVKDTPHVILIHRTDASFCETQLDAWQPNINLTCTT